MIVVTVFHSILNQMEFHLVQNLKENRHHDHISFNVKGIGSIVFSLGTHTQNNLYKSLAKVNSLIHHYETMKAVSGQFFITMHLLQCITIYLLHQNLY